MEIQPSEGGGPKQQKTACQWLSKMQKGTAMIAEMNWPEAFCYVGLALTSALTIWATLHGGCSCKQDNDPDEEDEDGEDNEDDEDPPKPPQTKFDY